MTKTGSCLCGKVKFELKETPDSMGACHCGMCRKWSGGIYLGVTCAADSAQFENEDFIARYASSPWAERCFCRVCGSSLFYRVTAPGPHHGEMHFGFGTLDDPSGMHLGEEIFSDLKPDAYAFSNHTRKMTEADIMALFTSSDNA